MYGTGWVSISCLYYETIRSVDRSLVVVALRARVRVRERVRERESVRESERRYRWGR